jgi:hypothetical protein
MESENQSENQSKSQTENLSETRSETETEPASEAAVAAATVRPRRGALLRFLRAPIEPRSYGNLLYLALAFPCGLAYFIFLAVGLSVGLGLTIVWVGLPILALVLAISFGLAAVERQLAIHLLGARVPPMALPAVAGATPWQRARGFLSNPVTWKGMGYLAVKFPLGLASFVLVVTLGSAAGALLSTPFLYTWLPIDFFDRPVDNLGLALACGIAGAVLALVSLNLFNLLAAGWRQLARTLLGSARHAQAAI